MPASIPTGGFTSGRFDVAALVVPPISFVASPLPFDVEVRFRHRLTGLRLFFDPDKLLGVEVQLTEAGGTDSIRVDVAQQFDAAFAPSEGCIVEVLVLSDAVPSGRQEPWPRWRAILSSPERSLESVDKRSLLAYGFMEDMNHVALSGTLISLGVGDVANLAAQVLAAYAAQRSWLVYEAAISDTGVLRQAVEVGDSDCRRAMDAIAAQGPSLIVWGWRVNPATGANQFVFRARTSSVGNGFYAENANVQAYVQPKELAPLANAILLSGGVSAWENRAARVTKDNTSFEKSEIRGPASGGNNLVGDYSFEKNDGTWTFSSGANSKQDTSPVEGKRVLELTGSGSSAQQAIGSPATLIAGQTFIVSFQARKNAGTDTRTGTWKLSFKDAGGSIIGSPVARPFAPASAAYAEVRGAELCPAGAASALLEITATNTGSGKILVDTVGVFSKGNASPTGWEFMPHGDGASVELFDSTYTADHWPGDGFGRTSLRVRGSFQGADDHDGFLRPEHDAELDVTGNEALRLIFRLKLTPGTDRVSSPRMLIVAECRDGSSTVVGSPEFEIVPGAVTNDWQAFSLSFQVPSAASKLRIRLVFRGDVDILVDAVQLRDQAAGDEYIRGANWERYIRAEDICDAGSAAFNSASVYDRRTAYAKNESLTIWDASAQSWAKAYLSKAAVLPVRARLSLIHEAAQIIDPLDGLLVRIAGVAEIIPDDYASRVSYRFSALALAVDADLGGEPPSLARFLAGAGSDTQSRSIISA